MLRKITPAIPLLLLVSTSAWSNTFYVGIEGGPNSTDLKQAASVLGTGVASVDVKDTSHFSGTGFTGSLFGGYAWVINQFYLAAEANFALSSVDFSSSNSDFLHGTYGRTDYKMQHGFGISVLPGYLFKNATLFFVRLGYENNNLKVSTTDPSLANINKNLDAFRYGLGINQTISQHFSVRMEYNRISYHSTSFTTVDPKSAVTKATKISPQSDQVMFGLVYNIA